jgi:hypothetical protein
VKCALRKTKRDDNALILYLGFETQSRSRGQFLNFEVFFFIISLCRRIFSLCSLCLLGFYHFINVLTIDERDFITTRVIVLCDGLFLLVLHVLFLLLRAGVLSTPAPEADANTPVDCLLGLGVNILIGLGDRADAVAQHASYAPLVQHYHNDDDSEGQENRKQDDETGEMLITHDKRLDEAMVGGRLTISVGTNQRLVKS